MSASPSLHFGGGHFFRAAGAVADLLELLQASFVLGACGFWACRGRAVGVPWAAGAGQFRAPGRAGRGAAGLAALVPRAPSRVTPPSDPREPSDALASDLDATGWSGSSTWLRPRLRRLTRGVGFSQVLGLGLLQLLASQERSPTAEGGEARIRGNT